ncbi:uncharacterized protein ACR2FA_011499 [Aphomia sociella]
MKTERLFEHIQGTPDLLLQQIPFVELVVLGDFNVRHIDWLESRVTDHAEGSAFDISLTHLFSNNCIEHEKTIKTDNDKKTILNKINTRRNKVASGELRSFSSAGNMMKLEWSEDLEISAQKWADQCVVPNSHNTLDKCRDLENELVGQNIATVYGESPGLSPMALVDVWYMELLHTNVSIISSYIPSSQTGLSHYDYFTQLVWAESVHVGCGSVKYKQITRDSNKLVNRTINRLVCNFSPSGNLFNKAVYIQGAPCSLCSYDSVCDSEYQSLCGPSFRRENASVKYIVNTQKVMDDSRLLASDENSTTYETTPLNEDDDHFTPYNYFSGFFEVTRDSIVTNTGNNSSCKDLIAVDNFVELLKKKLSKDPMFKELLLSTTTQIPEITYTDESVAALVSKIYSKKESTTTTKSTVQDHINSTLLVDLIEAVIFRSGDKISSTENIEQTVQQLRYVSPVKIQAELAEIKMNHDFTGHYFFPEDDSEETGTDTTEIYDISEHPISDIVLEIEDLKRQKNTKDFLEEILEFESATESNTFN